MQGSDDVSEVIKERRRNTDHIFLHRFVVRVLISDNVFDPENKRELLARLVMPFRRQQLVPIFVTTLQM